MKKRKDGNRGYKDGKDGNESEKVVSIQEERVNKRNWKEA